MHLLHHAASVAALGVDPVPWARAQMGFTLAAHIVLVPLGVAWAFITLVANWRGIRRDDEAALLLARRWSRYMGVTFAVGAVTGTVLTFEFGLLWPNFMEKFGGAFGVPFAVEGLFFFVEAVFIAIYLYGWTRLPPRVHLLTGIPIVVAGIGGTASVVAANAWMNEPGGFTLRNGKVVDVDFAGVFFNKAMPYEVVHMLVAAYLVAGFLVASVYAVAMLRGRRDRYHRLGFLIPFTIAAIATPVQMVVGDQLARWVYQNEPTKFAAIELVPRTARDVPETVFGRLTESGRVEGGIALPGVASILSDPSTGTRTQIRGLESFPANARPTAHEATVVHWAWDVMIGIASGLFLLSAWFAVVWWRRRDLPRTPWFLRAAAAAGVASVVALEAGWVVTEVGRQPWIVRGSMRVGDAATGNEGVWVSFLVIVAVYVGVAVTLVLVLRQMARRFREADPHADALLPYTPRTRRQVSADDRSTP